MNVNVFTEAHLRSWVEVDEEDWDVERITDGLKLSNGADVFYVTVSTEPPVSGNRELTELEEMDTILKSVMLRDEIDAKTLREIVGERRQIVKQINSLRAALNTGDASNTKGKLDALKGKDWEER